MDTVEELQGERFYDEMRKTSGGNKGIAADDGMFVPAHRFDCVNIGLHELKTLVADLREENSALRQKAERADELERICSGLKRKLRVAELMARAKRRGRDVALPDIYACGFTGKRRDVVVKKRLAELDTGAPYLFFGERLYRLVPADEPASTDIEQ